MARSAGVCMGHKLPAYPPNSKQASPCFSATSTSVRDLGVLLESDLFTRRHVAWTIGSCFRQLRLRVCIKSLPLGAVKAAVAAFVTSKVDRCNSLLAGAPPGGTPVGA